MGSTRLPFLAAVLVAGALPGLASTYTVPSLSGASIQATINTAAAAGSNNTVFFPAGSYNIGSAISVPCNGLTLTGPVATPATAVLNATFGGNDIFTMSGCSGLTVTYLSFQNTGGLYFSNSNNSNINIQHNQFGHLPSSIGGQSNASAAIYFDGSLNSTDQNITIEHNVFGDANSCTAVFAVTTDQGGYCVGVYQSSGILIGFLLEYNEFYHVEEGAHIHQIANYSSGATESVLENSAIRYNYVHNHHRIAFETQVGVIGTQPYYVADNFIVNPHNPSYITMFISNACCQFGRTFSTSTSQPSHVDDNVLYTDSPQTVGSFHAPVIGIEYWAAQGSTANNNVMGGAWSNMVDWGFEGSGSQTWYIQGNYLCAAYNGHSIGNEEGQTNKPIGWDGTGNTLSATCSQQTSTAPTISPASGAYTSPPTITLSNPGTNTSTYFTTDGSTPVPGSGTTQLYTGPFNITLPATIQAVGMWGVAPQPVVHEAPYGYKPSAVQSASYTATGGITLASVALSNVGTVHSLIVGASIQMTATCSYSDGSTTNCNAPDAHGNSVSSWNSSNGAVTISASGLATGASMGSATITATVGGLTTPAWAMAVTPVTVSLNSIALATTGGVSSLPVGAINQLIAMCAYSDSSTTNCGSADSHGNVVNPWTSTAPTVATVSASGVVSGVAAGTTNLRASVTPSGGSAILSNSLPLTVTGSKATLVSAYLGTRGSANTMTVGGTLQFSAHCVYSDATTTDCSVADIHGNAVTLWLSSDTTLVTIGSVGGANPGLATAVAAGAPNIKAHIGSLVSSQWNLTISTPTVTLTGVSLATTGGVTGLFVGNTNALMATCIYSDGSSTNCTTTDSQGNQAGSYTSSAPAHATVNAGTGVVTGVAAGTTMLSASAGGFTSMAIPLTILAVPSGTYNITITGPVSFSGRVQF